MSEKKHKAPGKHYRSGITVTRLAQMFPDEEAATRWFEQQLWPDGERCCTRCGGLDTHVAKHRTMPYRCRDCKRYFSVKTGTALQSSKISLKTWVWAIYLEMTSLKGVSSMKLHRDLGVTQKTAWFMLHRIREAFTLPAARLPFKGPVEVDETWVGGRKPRHLPGRGMVGKTPVVGAKDRASGQVVARVIRSANHTDLREFVSYVTDGDTAVYTDGASAYRGRPNHEWVNHSAGEYVRYLNGVKIHTNSIESFWSMLKRAHKGVYHKLSPKHLQRYIQMFAGRNNVRELDTIEQMEEVVAGMIGRRLMYRDLITDNGLPSYARSA